MCSIVWPQCWQAVGGPRDKIWDFVALVWPILSRVITSSSAQVLISLGWTWCWFQDIQISTMYIHTICFWPPVECRGLPTASNQHSKQLPVVQCHGKGSPLLAGPLSHSPQWNNDLATSRSGHGYLCRSVPRGYSWSVKWEGFEYLRPQLPASKTLRQSKLWHRAIQDPCDDIVQWVYYDIVLYRIHVTI